ncbi:MAG: YceD family protein [Methylocystis sp.]|uniref:YceD family protein n=1 Tax=Methylocystis sp. TaxID=1911079 RepID=UPI003DA5D624
MTKDMLGGQPAKSEPAPLSRLASLSETPPEGLDVDIVANAAERAALAELNGLPAIDALTAALRLRRWRGDGLEVTGELRARLRQTCVVTLEDFDTEVVESIEMRFAPPAEEPRPRSRRHEPEPEPHEHDALAEDPPDPLVGGVVDLGALVAEFFTLALDPYPRKPGAEFVEPAPEDASNVSPFAQLRRLRDEPPKDA